jgi:hypothetical protein
MMNRTGRRIRNASVLLVLMLCISSCSEKLPEGPDTQLEDVLVMQLTTDFESYAQENTYEDDYEVPEGITWLEFKQLSSWKVYFRVRLENTFDEPVVGTKYIDATIRVWDKRDSTRARTLTVLDTLSDETIIIQPGDQYTVFSGDRFIWDQKDDRGAPFAPKDTFMAYVVEERLEYNKYTDVYYRHCDTLDSYWTDSVIVFRRPIEIQAQASVQIFREYEGMYWKSDVIEFPIVFLSHAGWTPVVPPCKEGYLIENP